MYQRLIDYYLRVKALQYIPVFVLQLCIKRVKVVNAYSPPFDSTQMSQIQPQNEHQSRLVSLPHLNGSRCICGLCAARCLLRLAVLAHGNIARLVTFLLFSYIIDGQPRPGQSALSGGPANAVPVGLKQTL